MKATWLKRGVAVVVAGLGTLAMPAVSQAAVIYDIDFSSLSDRPADWTPLSPSANLEGWRVADGGYGYVRDLFGHPNGGLSSYTGQIDGGSDASSLANYMLDSSFWKSSSAASNFTGVAARIQDANNYYTAFMNASNQLFIRRVAGGANQDLSTVTINGTYSPDETWRLTFSVAGDHLEARVYDSTGALAGTASATDSTFSTGTFGLRVQTSVGHGLFESLTASTVDLPEPVLTASPESGHIFDLGILNIGEATTLQNAIALTNDGTGVIARTNYELIGSQLFDIAGFIREGTMIDEGESHLYDVVFFGSETLGVHEAQATIVTTAGEVTYTLRATVIPEPASLALFGVGVAVVACGARRRRAK